MAKTDVFGISALIFKVIQTKKYILYTKFKIPWILLFVCVEKAMAPHSSTLAWKIPWTEEPDGLSVHGVAELDTTEQLHFHFSLSCIGEGNGNPLQDTIRTHKILFQSFRSKLYILLSSLRLHFAYFVL